MEMIAGYWLEWLMGLVAAGFALAFRSLAKRLKESGRKQEALEMGIQALLRDRVVQAYYHYHDRGWITLHGLENVEAMYREYHNLGGNGTVTKLVEDLRNLPMDERGTGK